MMPTSTITLPPKNRVRRRMRAPPEGRGRGCREVAARLLPRVRAVVSRARGPMILSRVSRRRPVRAVPLLALGLALLLVVVGRALAHDIPARVTVLAFVKPEGRVLRIALRAPLEAMRDIPPPLRAGAAGDGTSL